MLCEVVGHTPEEVFVHIAEAVALTGQEQHIEALVRADKCIDNTQGVTGVYILVDVAVNEQQMTLKA